MVGALTSSSSANRMPDPTQTLKFDPVCIIHGKKMSEHVCLYCCLCYKTLTVDECSMNAQGQKEDVCKDCAADEQKRLTVAPQPAR